MSVLLGTSSKIYDLLQYLNKYLKKEHDENKKLSCVFNIYTNYVSDFKYTPIILKNTIIVKFYVEN